MEKKKKFKVETPEGFVSGIEIAAIEKAALEKRLAVKFQFYWFSLLEAADRWKHNKGIASGILDGKNRVCHTSVTFWEKSPPNYPDYKLVGKVEINTDINCVRGIDETAFNAGHFERTPPPEKVKFRKSDPMDRLVPLVGSDRFETEVPDDIFEDD